MDHHFISFFEKLTLLFLLVSMLPHLHRCSAESSTEKELTFAMIKPDGVSGNYTTAIKKIISDFGFGITNETMVQLDEETVKNFYAEHSLRSFFPGLVQYMTSGPVLMMVLEKANAVADWRTLIGPTDAQTAKVTHPHSIRAMCGMDLQRNCVHGSDSPLSAVREIAFFFEKSSSAFLPKHDEL